MRRATGLYGQLAAERGISIHALHEESDSIAAPAPYTGRISIHALHEESDRQPKRNSHVGKHFNPRSP